MKEEKVNEILDKVRKGWCERMEAKLRHLKATLLESPHDDGLMPITLVDDKGSSGAKTYLVPMEDIILKGIKGEDVDKYPLKKEKE